MIILSWLDLLLAACLVALLAVLSALIGLSQASGKIVLAAVRTALQLFLIGWVLKLLFAQTHPGWVGLMAVIMLLAAGYEVTRRQQRGFKGWLAYGMGTGSIFFSSFLIVLFTLWFLIEADPWYKPQYAISLLGMLLGNTMNGISLGLDRLTQSAWQQKGLIETRLMLGHSWSQTISDIRRDSIRTGMIPIMNAMAAAGIITLPGLMTGQILAGSSPVEAVKYQILIMFLIVSGTGFGTITAVYLGARRLFDERERLCLDRLK
ncbi:MAG: iron export ABC transporter permease subunit FetB [Gammaproteobacteria bacterium]|nr:iron export ABC transporter permease subunit FetB [Gammaproteobacteria bacterium]